MAVTIQIQTKDLEEVRDFASAEGGNISVVEVFVTTVDVMIFNTDHTLTVLSNLTEAGIGWQN